LILNEYENVKAEELTIKLIKFILMKILGLNCI